VIDWVLVAVPEGVGSRGSLTVSVTWCVPAVANVTPFVRPLVESGGPPSMIHVYLSGAIGLSAWSAVSVTGWLVWGDCGVTVNVATGVASATLGPASPHSSTVAASRPTDRARTPGSNGRATRGPAIPLTRRAVSVRRGSARRGDRPRRPPSSHPR
jgi:hypothetical protein